jgi:hypothetical protein
MDYFKRTEVSNSDLTSLKKYFQPERQVYDIEQAYRFGSLVDAIVTESHRVNFLMREVDGEKYNQKEFETAVKMKDVFLRDDFCRHVLKNASTQHVAIKNDFEIQFCGHRFTMPVRCKFDFYGGDNSLIDGDLKSTACLSESSFVQSVDYFDYDRQAAWYMDIERRSRFVFLAISKKNFKIFKFAIKRGDPIYERGRAKYQELAFRYWYMFGDLSTYKSDDRNNHHVGHEAIFEEAF